MSKATTWESHDVEIGIAMLKTTMHMRTCCHLRQQAAENSNAP
jgi:hypothetical protein